MILLWYRWVSRINPILEIESDSYKVEEYIEKLDVEANDVGRIYIREILAARKRYNLKEKKDKAFDEEW